MNTPYKMDEFGRGIVYVKSVNVADLPDEVRASANGLQKLYAVHDAEGTQLALVADRRMAFVLARQHDFKPVPVH